MVPCPEMLTSDNIPEKQNSMNEKKHETSSSEITNEKENVKKERSLVSPGKCSSPLIGDLSLKKNSKDTAEKPSHETYERKSNQGEDLMATMLLLHLIADLMKQLKMKKLNEREQKTIIVQQEEKLKTNILPVDFG